MIITVLLLALLVGGVGFIVTASRRLQGQPLNGQMIRRGFQYVLLYALLIGPLTQAMLPWFVVPIEHPRRQA